MHAHARAAGHLDSATWFAVIDALGITAASGARSRFARAVGRELADQGVPQQCVQLLPFVPTLLVKLGARGVVLAALLGADDARLREPAEERFVVARSGRTGGAGEVGGVYLRHFEAVETVGAGDVVSVNGAGDTFLGAVVARLVAEGKGGSEGGGCGWVCAEGGGDESGEFGGSESCVEAIVLRGRPRERDQLLKGLMEDDVYKALRSTSVGKHRSGVTKVGAVADIDSYISHFYIATNTSRY